MPLATASRYQPAANIFPGVNIETPESLAESFSAAMQAGDVDGAMRLWSEDAAIVDASGRLLEGRQAVGEALRMLVHNGARLELTVEGVFTAGDVALVSGTLRIVGADGDGREFAQESSSLVVYRRGPEGWRIALDAPWGLPRS